MNALRSEQDRLQTIIWKSGLYFDVVGLRQFQGNKTVCIVKPPLGIGHEAELAKLMAVHGFTVYFVAP